jgi:hypothetical protein
MGVAEFWASFLLLNGCCRALGKFLAIEWMLRSSGQVSFNKMDVAELWASFLQMDVSELWASFLQLNGCCSALDKFLAIKWMLRSSGKFRAIKWMLQSSGQVSCN